MKQVHIGSHPSVQDARYWSFARTSGLPPGTFDKSRRSAILTACATIAAALAVAGLTVLLAYWGL